MKSRSSPWQVVDAKIAKHKYLLTRKGQEILIPANFVPIASLSTWCLAGPMEYLQTNIRGTVQFHRYWVILDYFKIKPEFFCSLSKNQQEDLVAELFRLFRLTGLSSDHASGHTNDNTEDNLRLATDYENMWNSKQRCDRKYPYRYIKQVSSEKWIGFFKTNRETFKTAEFESPRQAAMAVDPIDLRERGYYAVLNGNPDKPLGDEYEGFRVGRQSIEWCVAHNIKIPWYIEEQAPTTKEAN